MSSRPRRRIALSLAAVSLTAGLAGGLAACGTASGAGPSGAHASRGGEVKIGLLLPDNRTARYANFDKPLFEEKVKELCAGCTVMYANAESDVATQHQQVNSMITKGVDVLVLMAVDTTSLRSSVKQADAAGIPVVAYDRPVQGPVSGYVTFNAQQIGTLQGEALLQAVASRAHGHGRVVVFRIPKADVRERSLLAVLKGKVKLDTAYGITTLGAEEAAANMSAAIARLGPGRIAGVAAINDTTAAGAIRALKDAHVAPLPPVVGQDADLAAVQRIVTGEQYMTVYKPFKPEADAAAEMAVALGRGESLRGITNATTSDLAAKNVPTVLLAPAPLTVGTIKDTVVKDGIYTIDQICTPKLASACAKAGLR